MIHADMDFSDQFLDGIFSLGICVRIIGLEKVVEKYVGKIRALLQMYRGNERPYVKML